jgi:hypothetical protein
MIDNQTPNSHLSFDSKQFGTLWFAEFNRIINCPETFGKPDIALFLSIFPRHSSGESGTKREALIRILTAHDKLKILPILRFNKSAS